MITQTPRCATKNTRTTNTRGRIVTLFTVLTALPSLKGMRVYWGKKIPLENHQSIFGQLFSQVRLHLVPLQVEQVQRGEEAHWNPPWEETPLSVQGVCLCWTVSWRLRRALSYFPQSKHQWHTCIYSGNPTETIPCLDGRVQTCMHRLFLQMHQQTWSQGEKGSNRTI